MVACEQQTDHTTYMIREEKPSAVRRLPLGSFIYLKILEMIVNVLTVFGNVRSESLRTSKKIWKPSEVLPKSWESEMIVWQDFSSGELKIFGNYF